MPFSALFQLYCCSQCTYLCRPGVSYTISFPNHWLFSSIAIIETTDRSDQEINTVTMTTSILARNYQSPAVKLPVLATWFIALYNTNPKFNNPEKEGFENIVGKGENAGNQHFLLFPQYFLPFPKQYLIFFFFFLHLCCSLQIL